MKFVKRVISWAYAHPKKFYKYAMLLLVLFVGTNIVQIIFFPVEVKALEIPSLYRKSEKIIVQNKAKIEEKEKRLEEIVRELQGFKEKHNAGLLTHSDSLRIEFLYNEFQKIKDGKEEENKL